MIPPAARGSCLMRDRSAKMSKSDPSDQSRINLTDEADAIAAKLKKARTDPEPLPSEIAGWKDGPSEEPRRHLRGPLRFQR